jgi:hypothetical protein
MKFSKLIEADRREREMLAAESPPAASAGDAAQGGLGCLLGRINCGGEPGPLGSSRRCSTQSSDTSSPAGRCRIRQGVLGAGPVRTYRMARPTAQMATTMTTSIPDIRINSPGSMFRLAKINAVPITSPHAAIMFAIHASTCPRRPAMLVGVGPRGSGWAWVGLPCRSM